MRRTFIVLLVLTMSASVAAAQNTGQLPEVKITNGIIQGLTDTNGVSSFKGIPYAKPPVGDLRWKAPQPVDDWQGVLKADKFGPQAMQRRIFSDMVFRSSGISEDCLYLNVWAPANFSHKHLPVLVYFYGGGFMAGDGSEPRYDGESMARRGIVAITVNYRLGVFGFFAYPALTQESPDHASGNYGLLDQNAALRWVQKNIAAFGGDPKKVTIAGESAGSESVCAQMASPLSKGLFVGAIGESGSVLGNLLPEPLSVGEQKGMQFAAMMGDTSLAQLRAIPADQLLQATANPQCPHFHTVIDGYFFPVSPAAIFSKGMQSKVPLLAGWNSAEVGYQGVLGNDTPTVENYQKALRRLYGSNAGEILKLYPASTEQEVMKSATALASDRFIVYATWKWMYMDNETSGKPVYRYLFSQVRIPKEAPTLDNPLPTGARHSSEIEYALGNLYSNMVYNWSADDYKTSDIMQTYFANFIKTGNPNGAGLPRWPVLNNAYPKVMNINKAPFVEAARHDNRYLLLDSLNNNQ